LEAVAAAATTVFGRVGYRRARTADVAAAANMSAGSLFTYVESKDALFHLVFVQGFGLLGESLPSLPISTPAPGETVALIERELGKAASATKIRAALKTAHPVDVADELRGIIEDRYTVIERLWPLLAVIERCAVDLPELEAFYFGRARVGHYRQLARYLERRAADGHLRTMTDAAATARLVYESVAWFAWHRREGRDAHDFDDETARRTVTEFVCAALLLENVPRAR